MSRPQNPQRYHELEQALVDYLLEHGITNLTFRHLAEALGISTYTLVYHFQNIEGVRMAALVAAEERQRQMVSEWMQANASLSAADLLIRYWQWTIRPEQDAYNRLFYEMYGVACSHPEEYRLFLKKGGARPWLDFLTTVVEPSDRETIASIILHTISGATLDLLTTGDLERVTRSVVKVADWLKKT